MAAPNWADVAVLKGELYLKIEGTSYDTELIALGEQITARMISVLNTTLYTESPPAEMVRACLMQCNFEWRQRHTPGLQSVQFQDGSVNKYQTTQFLTEVQAVLDRNKYYTIYPTTF